MKKLEMSEKSRQWLETLKKRADFYGWSILEGKEPDGSAHVVTFVNDASNHDASITVMIYGQERGRDTRGAFLTTRKGNKKLTLNSISNAFSVYTHHFYYL